MGPCKQSLEGQQDNWLLEVLPIDAVIFPDTGIQENLADKAGRLGISIYRFGKAGA